MVTIGNKKCECAYMNGSMDVWYAITAMCVLIFQNLDEQKRSSFAYTSIYYSSLFYIDRNWLCGLPSALMLGPRKRSLSIETNFVVNLRFNVCSLCEKALCSNKYRQN